MAMSEKSPLEVINNTVEQPTSQGALEEALLDTSFSAGLIGLELVGVVMIVEGQPIKGAVVMVGGLAVAGLRWLLKPETHKQYPASQATSSALRDSLEKINGNQPL